MKKIIFNLVLAFAMIVSFASCDSDDSISVPKDQKQNVNLSMYEQVFGIHFACEGKWNTEVIYSDNDEKNWLKLTQESGSGDGEIKCIVPANGGNKKREAIIKLTCGSNSITFNVLQNSITEELANLDENGGELDASKFGMSIPLGFGIEIKKNSGALSIAKNQIFCIGNWNDPEVSKYKLAGCIDSLKNGSFQLDFKTGTALDTSHSSIKGNLKVDMSFAMFKLGLSGKMNLANKRSGNKFTTAVVTPCPVMAYGLKYSNVLNRYKMIPADSKAKDLVFASDFMELKNKIEEAVVKKDEEAFQFAMDILDIDYGPLFCVNVEIGGDVNITSTMEMSNLADTMDIGGKLSAGFSGAFKISGEVEVNYLSEAFSSVTDYSVSMTIKGGTSNSRGVLADSIINIIGKLNSNKGNAENMKKACGQVTNLITDWMKGIKSYDSNTFTVTNITVAPVWELFSKEAKEKIKAYFKKEYPNKSKGECPYLYNIQEIAE